ncbi:MAG TPA: citramalate synthase, partial [Thermoleophilaceae bacterium]|nr:citramalate synthase [Thermoleophilaceae bacterium]
MNEQVLLYDTTLRDGMQGEGMSLSVEEKVRVAHALDSLGVQLIEAGFPSSNPKEEALFAQLAGERFEHAEIAAFGMTRRRGVRAEEDEALRLLADSFAPVCTLVGKTWALHLEKVTKVDSGENLAMIEESIAFLRSRGKRVIYDAEHFFDGYRQDPEYALRCLRAAVSGGAENVTLCDTNGSSLPGQIAEATEHVVAALDGSGVSVGIHTHDDAGCGVANSVVAVERGARLVQGTMNGYGERCGNANLVSILPALQLKLGYELVSEEQLARLTETAHLVDEICNVAPNPNQPYVGKNAFAHKGGMHVAGIVRDARTFEHMDPAQVGNDRELLISELSGKGTVQARAEQRGVQLDEQAAARVVDRVKQLEHRGFQFEAADGSFDLLIKKETGDYEPLFRLESWRAIVEKREDGRVMTEATIKIWVEGERYIRTAEGNGPVNALDRALRS